MQFFRDIFNLFFPDVCPSCQEQLVLNEKVVCIACRHDLPQTDYMDMSNNFLEKQFYGRVKLEEVTALFYFSKRGKIQHLIHQLKYKGQEEIGVFFGEWLGTELKHCKRFKNIDCIVPIPIHTEKKKVRGYNQLTKLGKVIESIVGIPFIENNLIRTIHTNTQTHKGRVDRFLGAKNHFSILNKDSFEGKHVLLIDDVITTGATIEACANHLLNCKNTSVSVAVIAYAN